MNLNWGAWVSGLISAVATGIVTIIGVMAAYGEPPKNWWAWVILSLPAGKAFWDYIRQTPPPIGKVVGILLVFFFLTGCAGQFQGIGDIGTLDLKNATETRKLAKDLLSTWKLNSGFIRGALGPKLSELPASVVMAMDELDKLAMKPDPDDWDLGYSLGLRVRMLSALVFKAIELYAPDVLKAIPSLLKL